MQILVSADFCSYPPLGCCLPQELNLIKPSRMPFDQKRINGPETSFSYKQFVESGEKPKPKEFKEKRADGRKWDENRKLGENSCV